MIHCKFTESLQIYSELYRANRLPTLELYCPLCQVETFNVHVTSNNVRVKNN